MAVKAGKSIRRAVMVAACGTTMASAVTSDESACRKNGSTPSPKSAESRISDISMSALAGRSPSGPITRSVDSYADRVRIVQCTEMVRM